MQVVVSTHGARLVQIAVPDANGQLVDVALGYDSLDGYLLGQQSMGAIIGRWAGRLRSGRLSLPEGEPLQLPTNSGPHHHHGGPRGSRFQVFEVGEVHANAITLQHVFRTEDDGVPGTVRLVLNIAVSPDNALSMTWSAEAADAPTIVNITGHAFFNLAGVGSTHGHVLQVPSSRYVPLAADVCPTGELASVDGTPFDFRAPRAVGDSIAAPHEQLERAGGLDHYLVLDDLPQQQPSMRSVNAPWLVDGVRLAAVLTEPLSGRSMEVWTTAPGVQVYAGHGLKADPARDLGRGTGGAAGCGSRVMAFAWSRWSSPMPPTIPLSLCGGWPRATWCMGASCTDFSSRHSCWIGGGSGGGGFAPKFVSSKFRLSVRAHTAFHCNTTWKGNTP